MVELRTDRRLRLLDITLSDIARVCHRYGIRVRGDTTPDWKGPWRLDRRDRKWWRLYLQPPGHLCMVERSLDAY